MATPGRPTDEATIRMIERMHRAKRSYRFMAREAEVSLSTIYKYLGRFRSKGAARGVEIAAVAEINPPQRF